MGATLIIVAIIGILLVFGGSIFMIKRTQSPERLVDKYESSEERNDVFVKKYKEADFEYYRGPFMRLGLISVLLLLILAFNYSKREKRDNSGYQVDVEEELVMDIPVTQQVQPPPPPPPPPPPQIEVVEDEEIIEEEPVIIDMEVEVEEVIEVVEVEVEVVDEPEPEPEEPEIFTVVEQQPQFPGGQTELLRFLGKNINYPPIAQENGIEGTVVVRFVVNETGGISDIQVVRDIGGGCGNEAVRVVKNMPKWTPGRQRGKAVKVYFTLPVRFKLE